MEYEESDVDFARPICNSQPTTIMEQDGARLWYDFIEGILK
jgi:hypothetical protein